RIGPGRARGRVAAVADSGVDRELAHVARAEYVAHIARALVHVEDGALARDDAGRVLAPVLQQQQAIVQQLVDRRMRDRTDDAAHALSAFPLDRCPYDRLGGPAFPGAVVEAIRPGLG